MRKDVADMWADALRSGEYKQTAGTLHGKEGYCCLGVLCDLHRQHTEEGRWFRPSSVTDRLYVCDDGTSSENVLPNAVQRWAGTTDDPKLLIAPSSDCDDAVYVTELNDDEGYTFAQLADLIQEQWENL